jgi:hypothetical protein
LLKLVATTESRYAEHTVQEILDGLPETFERALAAIDEARRRLIQTNYRRPVPNADGVCLVLGCAARLPLAG